MPKRLKIRWLEKPEQHDYPSAASYLSLVFNRAATAKLVRKLKAAAIVEFKSKDIFRASRLPLLPLSNSHVKKDQRRIIDQERLSPLLLVRDEDERRLIIADGYHRLCAVYAFDEDAVVPCKIV